MKDLDRSQANRYWVFRANYEGKAPFFFGSVTLPLFAAAHEVDAALRAAWDRVMPIAPPANVTPIPGAIFFAPEEELA